MRLPIRWKLLLAITGPLVVIYGSVLFFTFARLNARSNEELDRSMTQLAAHHAAAMDGKFRTVAQVARTTADLLNVQPMLSEEQLYDLLEANVRENPLIYGSCVAFAPYVYSGERQLFCPYVYRGATGLTRMDVADAYDYTDPVWAWYRVPSETLQPFWTEPFFDEGAGNIIMCTYVSPLVVDGQFRGTVNVDVALESLQQSIGEVDLQDGFFAIINREGRFISHPDKALIMNESIFTLAQSLGRSELSDLGQRMLSGYSGATRASGLKSDQEAWIFYAPIESSGWTFLAALPEATVRAFANQQLVFGIGAMLVGLVLITAMLFLVSARLTRPIARLAQSVRRLASGDLEAQSGDTRRRDEIGELAQTFNTMVRDLRAHVEELTRATAARERVESELRVARDIQSALLPSVFPPYPDRTEFQLHAVNAPARHVAGDFFDFFFVDQNELVFLIGDVSGKGVPAALYMAVSRTILRDLAVTTSSPARLLAQANRQLVEQNIKSMFLTLFVGRYDTMSGRLRYANAGHPPPFLLDSADRASEFGEVSGTILGILENEEYEEFHGTLQIGQRLVLYTDGATEARRRNGPLFTTDRFRDLLREHSAKPLDEMCRNVVDEIDAYQGSERSDDLTLLVLERLGNGFVREETARPL